MAKMVAETPKWTTVFSLIRQFDNSTIHQFEDLEVWKFLNHSQFIEMMIET
jgi:hypothetical protein